MFDPGANTSIPGPVWLYVAFSSSNPLTAVPIAPTLITLSAAPGYAPRLYGTVVLPNVIVLL